MTTVTTTNSGVTVTDDGAEVTVAVGTLPALHAATHASGGSDPVTLAQSQVTSLVSDLAGKAPTASPTFTGNINTSGNIISASASSFLPQNIIRNTNTDAYGPYLILSKKPSDNGATDGDYCGTVQFKGVDSGGTERNVGYFTGRVSAQGASFVSGRMEFYTTDSAGSENEAFRINPAGEMLVGYTADNGAYKLQVNSQIFATSATVATSDGRFKRDVQDLADGWDVIRALRPVSFKWKDQTPVLDQSGEVVREAHNFPNGTHVGFIAQEVKAALDDRLWIDNLIKRNKRPEVIAEDGTVAPEEAFLGIAEGNLIPILTSALQTAMDRIEALEARLDAAGL